MKCDKSHKCEHTNKLILGAILGGVVVGTSAVFLSSKQGKKLKDSAADKIQDVKEQLQEFLSNINDKTQSVTSDISDRAEGYADRLQDFSAQVREQIEALGTDENKDHIKTLLIGAILGGMLGAGASAYLNSDSKDKGDMFKNLGSSATSVKNTIKDILHALEERSGVHHSDSEHPSTIKDILDFASSGVQIWQKFQKR